MDIDRELLMHGIVEGVLCSAHTAIWDGRLNLDEARLAWLRVMQAMLASVVIDQQSTVMRELLANQK